MCLSFHRNITINRHSSKKNLNYGSGLHGPPGTPQSHRGIGDTAASFEVGDERGTKFRVGGQTDLVGGIKEEPGRRKKNGYLSVKPKTDEKMYCLARMLVLPAILPAEEPE
jgi:hypothetical protein